MKMDCDVSEQFKKLLHRQSGLLDDVAKGAARQVPGGMRGHVGHPDAPGSDDYL